MPARSVIPGLKRLPKPNGFSTWYWAASQITRNGADFQPRTARLWHGQGSPAPAELERIRHQAQQLTIDLIERSRGKVAAWRSRKVRSKRGLIYFVRAGERVKIGFSQDVHRRVSQLQTLFPEQLEVLLTMPGSIVMERELHRRFQDFAIAREWFLYVEPIAMFVEKLRRRGGEQAGTGVSIDFLRITRSVRITPE